MTDVPDVPDAQDASVAVAEPRWGLGDAALAFAAGIAGTLATTGIYVAVSGNSNPASNDTGLIIASLVGLWAGLFGVAWRASKRKGTGSLATDYGLRIEPRDIAIGVVVGLLCQFLLVNLIISLFSLIDNGVNVERQAKEVTGNAGGLRLFVLAPFLCVGAPFFEELYFRGLLQRSAVRRLGTGAGIVLSAVAFGLVHVTGDLSGWSSVALITALASFGAVLSWLAQRTGRLGPGLVAHATFNAITLLALAATR
jgi:membrane protease YdiL (CAAX protease family)